MSWAASYIQELQQGRSVKFRPRGASMSGRIDSGQLVTVEPVAGRVLMPGDAVLCRVNGHCYLHLIKAVGSDGRYQIGANHGHINGWCSAQAIFGVCTNVEP